MPNSHTTALIHQPTALPAFFSLDEARLRRIIKAHRGSEGVTHHVRCYALARDAAVRLGVAKDLKVRPEALPETVFLCAKARDTGSHSQAESFAAGSLEHQWRGMFHARVHVALDGALPRTVAGAALLRTRIDELGQVEFDEVRAALGEDDRVLSPADDREFYIEFAATYLELCRFNPELIPTTFPSLADSQRVSGILSADLADDALFSEGHPEGVTARARTTQSNKVSVGYATFVAFARLATVKTNSITVTDAEQLLERARVAKTRDNDAGAVLDLARACAVQDAVVKSTAEKLLESAARSFERRIADVTAPAKLALSSLLVLLARVAARTGRYAPEGRILFALQKGCLATERPERVVDVAGALLSLGRKKIVRELPVVREIRAFQALRSALKLAHRARLEFVQRSLLVEILEVAVHQGEANLRVALRPRIHRAIEVAGIRPTNAPERAAREKVVEELLDEIARRGFVSFGSVRDTLSRNQLKLDDIAKVRDLLGSDPLLRLDENLSAVLDGAYRSSDIYLRWLHKCSSLVFGTATGRSLMVVAVTPLLGAFLAIEAYRHVILPHLHGVTFVTFGPPTKAFFLVVAGLIFALLHSPGMRSAVRQFFALLGSILGFVFATVPTFIFARPALHRWLAQPKIRFALRGFIVPGAIAVGGWRWMSAHGHLERIELKVAGGSMLALMLLLLSPIGRWLEETLFEQVLPAWRQVGHNFLLNLGQVIARVFEIFLDWFDRGLFRIEESLHFRGTGGRWSLVWKGAAGLAFGAVAYIARLYVTLMIEPEVNPLKHVPVVTIAHKLTLPFMPELLATLRGVFLPLGSVLGGTVAGITAFLAPSAFGFLAWELKENYKLYKGARRGPLAPALIGTHGETMRALLVPGFHSGTLAKHFRRLRRAAERESRAALRRQLGGSDLSGVGATRSLRGIRTDLRPLEDRIRGFAEREFCGLLMGCQRWAHGKLLVNYVKQSASRIRIAFTCPALGKAPCVLSFEAQSGNVVACIHERGFLPLLVDAGGDSVDLFENALVGLYHLSAVDFVREQVEANIPNGRQYDFDERGIVVWPTQTYDVEIRFAVYDDSIDVVEPTVTGGVLTEPPWVLDLRKVAFVRSPVGWPAWVAAWSAGEHATARIPRLALGDGLLGTDHERKTRPGG